MFWLVFHLAIFCHLRASLNNDVVGVDIVGHIEEVFVADEPPLNLMVGLLQDLILEGLLLLEGLEPLSYGSYLLVVEMVLVHGLSSLFVVLGYFLHEIE